MSAKRLVAGLAVLLIGAFTALTGATSARAADPCCEINLSGPDHGLVAGGAPAPFELHVKNNTTIQFRNIGYVFSIHLSGVRSNQVRLARQAGGDSELLNLAQTGDGQLRAFDSSDNQLDPQAEIVSAYAIQFLTTAPNGSVAITISVVSGRLPLGTVSATSIITGGVTALPSASPSKAKPSAKPSTTASDGAAPVIAPTDAGGQNNPPTDGAINRGDTGLPWYAYGFGVVLLLGGAALLGYLFLNRERDTDGEADDEGRSRRLATATVYGAPAVRRQPEYGAGGRRSATYGDGPDGYGPRGGRVKVYAAPRAPGTGTPEPTQSLPAVSIYPPAVDPYEDSLTDPYSSR